MFIKSLPELTITDLIEREAPTTRDFTVPTDSIEVAINNQPDDAIRRVVLLGRISLYGPGASRLHDEIIAVAARWIDPIARIRDELGGSARATN